MNTKIITLGGAYKLPKSDQPIDHVSLVRIVDNPTAKRVFVKIKEVSAPVILWEGADYDNIGDWTETQAEAKLVEVIKATATPESP